MVFGSCCNRTPPIVRDIKLVCVGIDGDGKTTVLKLLRGDDPYSVMSTNGFSKVSMAYSENFDVIVYDLGGGPRIRDIWENYYAEVHGAIFVIDTAGERINEAYECLRAFLKHDDLFGKPIFFVLNKVDSGKVDEIEFAEQADLHNVCGERKQSSYVTHVNKLEEKIAGKKGIKSVKERALQLQTPLLIQFCNFADKIIENYVELQQGVLAAEEKLRKRQDEARTARKLRLMQMEHEQRINGGGTQEQNAAVTHSNPSALSPPSDLSHLSDEVFERERSPPPSALPKNKVAPANGLVSVVPNGSSHDASVSAPQSDSGSTWAAPVREKPRLQRVREELERRKRETVQS